MSETFDSCGPVETEAFGERMAARLDPPAALLLCGPLGAGKTALVRGLASGCGVDPRIVRSPSFSLVHHYPGTPPLVHVDLYRLERLHDLHQIGLEELLESDAIVAIEWADKLPWQPRPAWRVDFEIVDADRRRIVVTAPE